MEEIFEKEYEKMKNLLEIFNILKDCYKNIDFRYAFYKKEYQKEYIVSFIRFTRKTTEELERIYESLREIDNNTEHFGIEFKVLPIEEIKSIWEDLHASAERTIGDFQMQSEINSKGDFINYLMENEKKENSIVFALGFPSKNIEHHNRFSFVNEELMAKGEKNIYPLIKRALHIENFNFNSELYSLIYSPVYLKIEESNIKFTNNYLTMDIQFHKFFEGCEMFFQITNLTESKSQKESFILTSDREKLRGFRYEGLNEDIIKIKYTAYFGNLDINRDNKDHWRLFIRLSHEDIEAFLIDLDYSIGLLYEYLDEREKIPQKILQNLIEPFLHLNLLKRTEAQQEANKIIQNFIETQNDQMISIILDEFKWLIEPNSLKIIQDYSSKAANRPDHAYYNFFRDLLILSCVKAIDEEIIKDFSSLSNINELLILYNINTNYNFKFQYSENSLAKLRDEIKYMHEEIFETLPNCHETNNLERRQRTGLKHPSLWSECEGHYDTISTIIYFIRNNFLNFSYHNVHLTIRVRYDNWEELPPHNLEKIQEFIKKIIALPNIHLIETRNLPGVFPLASEEIIQTTAMQISLKDENIKKDEKVIYDNTSTSGLSYYERLNENELIAQFPREQRQIFKKLFEYGDWVPHYSSATGTYWDSNNELYLSRNIYGEDVKVIHQQGITYVEGIKINEPILQRFKREFQEGKLKGPTSYNHWVVSSRFRRRGGQAFVYKVKREDDEQEYALKSFLIGKNQNKKLERYNREVEALKDLKDFVCVIDLIDEGGSIIHNNNKYYYYVMELADYSLDDYISKNKLDLNEKVNIFQEILNCFEKINSKGYIHRDIKPQNVLIKDKKVKIADFGIVYHANFPRITSEDEEVGPRSFICPESLGGKSDDVGIKCDIYSLGKLLYFILSNGKYLPREWFDKERFRLDIIFDDEKFKEFLPIFKNSISESVENRFSSFKEMNKCLKKIMIHLRN